MKNDFNFEEFLMNLSLAGSIQNYFKPDIFHKIFYIDTINAKILLKVFNRFLWFSKEDFIRDKLIA